MKTTKQGHAWKRHVAVSLLTGEEIEFFERIEPEPARALIIRRMLGWNGATMYPLTEARP